MTPATARSLLRHLLPIVDLAGPAGRNTVFLIGSARSGTTWLENVINYRGDHRILFEPFFTRKVPASAGLSLRQYLRPGVDDPRFVGPIEQIFAGRLRNPWTDQFTRPGIYRRRLVKSIRSQLLAYWFHGRYPQVPIVFLLRHPVATALSAMRQGMKLQFSLAELFDNPELAEDHLAPFRGLLGECRDEFDTRILLWCIENYVPLRQFGPGQMHVAFYAELLTDPGAEIERLMSFLGRTAEPAVFEAMKVPSQVAAADSASRSGEDPVRSGLKHATPELMRRAARIMEPFGFDALYGDEPGPDPAVAARLRAGEGRTVLAAGPPPAGGP